MTEIDVQQLDADYYLLSFSNDELYDVLVKEDEWSEHDVAIARTLLKKKGVKIDEMVLKQQIDDRMAEFRKPDKNQTVLIAIGYLCAIFGGFLGLLFGYALFATKKELPNGEKVHRYSESNRKSGFTILVISAIVFTLSLIVKMTLFSEG